MRVWLWMKNKSLVISFYKHMVRISNNIFGAIYIRRFKRRIKMGKEEGLSLLSRGVKKYPESNIIYREIAKLEMKHENWTNAVSRWKKVLELTPNPIVTDYLNTSKSLQHQGNATAALNTLEHANEKYPNNECIIKELINVAKINSNWKTLIYYLELWNKHPNNNSSFSYSYFICLFEAYNSVGSLEKSKETLDSALRLFPKEKERLLPYYVETFLNMKDWNQAIHYISKSNINKQSFDNQIKLAMLYKIVGDQSQYETLMKKIIDNNKEFVQNDSLGYRKIILFDNGESRIEFYKKLEVTDSVIITFDAINMTWDKPSFAFRLLQKENLDIIAIRKKKTRTYQQDLHQEEFVKVVKPLLVGYRDKMSYGFSLGAYHTLYFASLLDCRILAIAPRLSIHPEFGRNKIIPKFKMQHQFNLPTNNKIEPIIVYDPKNTLDKKYITNGIIPFFPKAKIVHIPYGGHGIAPHLLKMGQLKPFVHSFLQKEVPVYNRKLKIMSPVYFKNLGSECLKHNKPNWALDLANKSLAIEPADKDTIKLKLKTLKKLNKLESAIHFAIESINTVPRNLDIRLYLTDFYIELGEIEKAESEIEKNIKKFGKQKSILKRQEKLKKIK